MIIEGFNLLLSPLSTGSDGQRFAEFLHIPVSILSFIAIILIVSGLVLYSIQLQQLGIDLDLPLGQRLMIVILGNLIYFIITWCYLSIAAPSSDIGRVFINLDAVIIISSLTIATQQLSPQ